jgi:hypothetical protein
MFRRTDIAMIALMIGVVTYTYTVKNGTKHASADLAKLQRQVEIELNAIDVLNADWSVLTSPARIQNLVEVHNAQLGLHPLDPRLRPKWASTISLPSMAMSTPRSPRAASSLPAP